MTNATLSLTARFALLEPWHTQIFTSVKKELRNEHLKQNKAFFRTYFPTKVLLRLTAEDLVAVYVPLIAKGDEKAADFIINRWILKHLDIYTYFERTLSAINPQIEEITQIEEENRLMTESVSKFGAMSTYIFAVFNSVAFSDDIFQHLRSSAINELTTSAP